MIDVIFLHRFIRGDVLCVGIARREKYLNLDFFDEMIDVVFLLRFTRNDGQIGRAHV